MNPDDLVALAEAAGLKYIPTLSDVPDNLSKRVRSTCFPPTPDEVKTFVNSKSPNAYVGLIDRRLNSRHYGERWARHWLDVARFAEHSGFEHDDNRPNAYHYRDFVIKAFNDDLPFDQFVRWQIAGVCQLENPDVPTCR